jgi:hypothetical protein
MYEYKSHPLRLPSAPYNISDGRFFYADLHQGVVIVCLDVGGWRTKNFSHPLTLSSCYKVCIWV